MQPAPHRRPKPPSPWNGTNNKTALRVWQMDTSQLVPAQLVYVPDPDDPKHGFLSPPIAMSLAEYRGYVHGTAPLWTQSTDPDPACVNLPVQGADVRDHEERAALVDATAAGGDVEVLVSELRSANASGVSRTTLIAELTAGVERAPDEAAADVLLELLDRVTGFCGPHARIDLAD
ncbi:hypothetical protein ACFQV2_21920 [Actinokineospora soli]|uniref:Uncharacterized protein n=1 Tax=Actinokineospora soli TaxID=1048753 RepID=A0ABW2TSI2_9PSEU